MAWEDYLLPVLVDHADGKTVPPEKTFKYSLGSHGNKMTRNHIGMAIVGESLRALRHCGTEPSPATQKAWGRAHHRLADYLRDELTNGLWGQEVLCETPHDAFHLAIAMFARLTAVESQDAELLRLTEQHCRALARLCATLSDPTGEVLTAATRVRLAKKGKPQKRPTHSALTAWWRYIGGDLGDSLRLRRDPLYVGLRAASDLVADDAMAFTREACAEPGPVPLVRPVIVHRWDGGHQVEIPKRNAAETGKTSGSKNPNGACDWLRAEYGKGKRGASRVTFGMLWQTPAPPVPKGATRI